MASKKIRVFLAEDYPVVRIGIRNLLDGKEDLEVVGEACDGPETIRLVEELKPDVLLLDMELPGFDGIEVARRLGSGESQVRILALSAYDEKELIRSMLELGAAGYLIKDEAPDMIEEAIRKVARGEKGWISHRIAAQMLTWGKDEERDGSGITRRERDVLKLVIDGKTNAAIAATLNMSEKTVEKHLTKIFAKLGVESRTDAAVYAIREKIIK